MRARRVDIQPRSGDLVSIVEVVRTWTDSAFFNVQVVEGTVLRFPTDEILLVTEASPERLRRH